MLPKHKDQCEKKTIFFFYGKHTQIFSLFCTVLLFFILVLLYFFFWGSFHHVFLLNLQNKTKKQLSISNSSILNSNTIFVALPKSSDFLYLYCAHIQSRQQLYCAHIQQHKKKTKQLFLL